MGLARRKESAPDLDPAEALSADALALIDHIGRLLAEEYVELLRSDAKGEKDESSRIRQILK